MVHTQAHVKAGQTVKLNDKARIDTTQGVVVEGAEYRVEDYADRVMGQSIWEGPMTFAVMHYMTRAKINGLPLDDEIVYGKIGALGHLVHVSELS